MADFNKAFRFVLSNEVPVGIDGVFSGVTIVDVDGGQTRFGIDSRSNPQAVTDGFYQMSDADACTYATNLFRVDYWNGIMGDSIVSDRIGAKYADMAFNQYIHEATLLVQRAVNMLQPNDKIVEDGHLGRLTLAAINGCDENYLLAAIVKSATTFYTELYQQNAGRYSESIYKGWINRINKLP
jgi:lysozyme family protein